MLVWSADSTELLRGLAEGKEKEFRSLSGSELGPSSWNDKVEGVEEECGKREGTAEAKDNEGEDAEEGRAEEETEEVEETEDEGGAEE